MSETSSELINPEDTSMTSHAIKKKLDSLAGSAYGLSDNEEGSSGHKRRGKLSLRWRWLRMLECRGRWKHSCNYNIDPHGEL